MQFDDRKLWLSHHRVIIIQNQYVKMLCRIQPLRPSMNPSCLTFCPWVKGAGDNCPFLLPNFDLDTLFKV